MKQGIQSLNFTLKFWVKNSIETKKQTPNGDGAFR